VLLTEIAFTVAKKRLRLDRLRVERYVKRCGIYLSVLPDRPRDLCATYTASFDSLSLHFCFNSVYEYTLRSVMAKFKFFLGILPS
jgi:hypothetical protein